MTIRLGPAWRDQDSGRVSPVSRKQWPEVVAPANRSHFHRLMTVADDILAICKQIDVSPTLSGSLAVLAYTQQPDIVVDDVDLACSEADFARLCAALTQAHIHCEMTPWHVLQAHREGMKVEFDSAEYWLAGLADRYRCLDIGRFVIRVVELDDLRELYRRGVRDLEVKFDDASQTKLKHMRSRYDLLAKAQDGRSRAAPRNGG